LTFICSFLLGLHTKRPRRIWAFSWATCWAWRWPGIQQTGLCKPFKIKMVILTLESARTNT
jgi:hypothetical protein